MDRVSDSERAAAARAVEAALADGRIVQADHDHRLDQLRTAQSSSEVQMIVHDLAHRDVPEASWATYEPPAAPAEQAVAYRAPETAPPPTAATAQRIFGRKRSSGGIGCLLIPLIIFFAAGGGTVIGVFNSDQDGASDSGVFESFPESDYPEVEGGPSSPRLFQRAGFEQMRDAIAEETGATTVFRVMLYQDYASVSVPARATGQRDLIYYYDGELADTPSEGSSGHARFDLATVEPRVVSGLVRQARRQLLDEPGSVFVVIQRPDPVLSTKGAWITVHVIDDAGASGFLEASLDGTVVKRYVSE